MKSLNHVARSAKDSTRTLAWSLTRSGLRFLPRPDPSKRIAVLVHSFDGYQRFWSPAVHYTMASVPTSVPIYFASETIPYSPGRVEAMTTGPGTYVSRLITSLRRLESFGFEYVFYLQEDMWLTRPLRQELIDELMGMIESHEIDCLKLGKQPFVDDMEDIRLNSGPIGSEEPAEDFRWFGSHRFALSHHVSIFRIRFLLESAYVARLFGKTSPLDQERFASAYLKPRIKTESGDNKRYRIAVFSGEPVVEYVHASAEGRLTDEARNLLADDPEIDRIDPMGLLLTDD